MRKRWAVLAVPMVALGLIAAGCGGGDEGSGPATSVELTPEEQEALGDLLDRGDGSDSDAPSTTPGPTAAELEAERRSEVRRLEAERRAEARRRASRQRAERRAAAERRVRNSVEYKLAVVDAGQRIETDEPVIKVYARLLDRLQPKCSVGRERVADIAVRGTQVYEEELGVDRSALQVLRAMDISLRDVSQVKDCSEVVALLIILERDG